MVRFVPQVAPLFRVRETIPLADAYRCGCGDAGDRAADSFGDAEVAVRDPCGEADGAAADAPVVAVDVAVPDPFDDADALEELEDEITTLAAHIHAATHRLLILIADFDHRRGWELGGHRSCAFWLSARTGIDLGAAREKVRTARALVGLPETSASMSRGELSFSQVRALSRVATEANEGDLLELARGSTTAQLERKVRSFRRGSRADEAELERERHERRALSVFPDEEGMYVIRGRLPAEVGALLMRAVEAASDALYRETNDSRVEAETDSGRAAAQRRADALGLLAERALAAGFGGRNEEGNEDEPGTEPGERSCAEPLEEGGAENDKENGIENSSENNAGDDAKNDARNDAENDAAEKRIPISGTRAERFQVFLHVEPQTLAVEGEPGRSELEDGTRVSPETARRIACDTGLVRVSHGPDGSILDVGRRTRTIPPSLRRALEVRDRGCRFPGCGLRFAEGHHIKHWADGGETSLSNCILVCKFHHRLVHEEGWQVEWRGPGRPVFIDPRGKAHFDGRQVEAGGRHPGPGLAPDPGNGGAGRGRALRLSEAEL